MSKLSEYISSLKEQGFKPGSWINLLAAVVVLSLVVAISQPNEDEPEEPELQTAQITQAAPAQNATADPVEPQREKSDAEIYIERGRALYVDYQFKSNESAIELFRMALELEPENAEAFAELANALGQKYQNWDRDEAVYQNGLRAAETAIRLNPDSSMAHKALGLLYNVEGKTTEAMKEYRRAVALDQANWAAHVNLATLLLESGNIQEAAEHFLAAHEVSPVPGNTATRIAEFHASRGEFAQASAWYGNALKIDPLDIKATSGLAGTELYSGNYAGALNRCRGLIDRLGESGQCLMIAGQAAYFLDDLDTAETMWSGEVDEWYQAIFTLKLEQVRMKRTGDKRANPEAVAAALGSADMASKMIGKPAHHTMKAIAAAMSGDNETALAELALARSKGWRELWFDLAEPAYEDIRDTAEFRDHVYQLKVLLGLEEPKEDGAGSTAAKPERS